MNPPELKPLTDWDEFKFILKSALIVCCVFVGVLLFAWGLSVYPLTTIVATLIFVGGWRFPKAVIELIMALGAVVIVYIVLLSLRMRRWKENSLRLSR